SRIQREVRIHPGICGDASRGLNPEGLAYRLRGLSCPSRWRDIMFTPKRTERTTRRARALCCPVGALMEPRDKQGRCHLPPRPEVLVPFPVMAVVSGSALLCDSTLQHYRPYPSTHRDLQLLLLLQGHLDHNHS
ncbi:unnamed protein product, partial [Pleuronectes platessa]